MIRIGIVGLGRLGKTHAENIATKISGAELVAACSLVENELDYASSELGVENLYTDFNKMIDSGNINAVVIVSPSHLHTEQINYAMEAGMHVFVEKPLGTETESIKNTVEIVNKHPKQVFQIGFMRRYDSSYKYAKERIDNGELGDISLIRCYGIDPASDIGGFLKFAKESGSGGIFIDFSIHDIDIVRWFTKNAKPEKAWAIGNNIAYPELNDYGETETGAAMMQLENGEIVFLVAGRNAPHGYHVETEVIGTKGMLRIGNTPDKNLVTIFDSNGVVKPTSANFPERFRESFVEELDEFVKSIQNGKQPEITVEDGLETFEIAKKLEESYSKKKLIEF